MDKKRELLIQLLEKKLINPSYKKIAIIGVSCRFPMSETLDEFWENLKLGRNCISEIPKDRWDWEKYFDEKNIYTKWGGFISDIDKFDALFFDIKPQEAEMIDPQERLFLETAWAAFEDAGLNRAYLERIDYNAGVFVGVSNCDYEWLSGEKTGKGHVNIAGSTYWSIANRVSYYLNFQGPSLSVDTSCSSSLTAIHLACQSLRSSECEIAIAGGVNLIYHPMHYLKLCAANLLSKDNKCKSFADNADGFVDGEGVGAVVLKPLDNAINDCDQIYGVILSSSINSCGKTSGYRIPNPNAQENLILKSLDKAQIDPRTISYVEAQGTGTIIGDSIEITALTKAYKKYTQDNSYCALGSVKSNIGHIEAAAGISGLIKILLQMKHKKLVQSLHSEKINHLIKICDTPFYIQKDITDWEQPFIKGEKYPRRAAISAFGASRANAHIIIEEYEGKFIRDLHPPYLFVLSAKSKERLMVYVKKMLDYIIKHKPDVSDITYTLQVGREIFNERLSILVESLDDLIEKLNRYISCPYETDKNIKYQSFKANRISLPTYPFEKKRYWIDKVEDRERIYIPPKNTLEIMLCQLWEEILNIKPVGVKDNFFEIGGHSVLAVSLMAKIEEKFGKNLPLATLLENQTIESLAKCILEDSYDLPWKSLVPIQSNGTKYPFFCIPGVGGNVTYFYHLSQSLGYTQPFYGLQPVGLDGISKPYTTVEEIAYHYISCIQEVQKQGPYFLGGHSIGGRIAYEMAIQLEKQNQKIGLLAILDVAAPIGDLSDDVKKYFYDDAYLFCEVAVVAETFNKGVKLNFSYDELKELSWDGKLNYLKERYQNAGLLPKEAHVEVIRGIMEVYKANRQLIYKPVQKANPFKIALFKGKESDIYKYESDEICKDEFWGWRRFSDYPVDVYIIPGDHHTMMIPPQVKTLAGFLGKLVTEKG
ncbi:MAG: hypothetical protein HQK79_09915 [Desulfobacterales bacterium]|nr:hypothetical protein [Desulfobacterales bacterium]